MQQYNSAMVQWCNSASCSSATMQYGIRPVVWGGSRHSGLALTAIKTCRMISFPRRDGRS